MLDLASAVFAYEHGESPVEIASMLGCTPSHIRSSLRKAGVKLDRSRGLKMAYAKGRRSAEEHGRKMRKHRLDERVYERELTPETAWALGVIVGDGCVVRHGSHVEGVEVCGDEDVCRKVAAIFGSGHPVIPLRGGCFVVRFFSVRLAASLLRYGIRSAKTESVRLPSVSSELLPHLMRGYLDADGCVTTRKQQRGRKRQLILSFKTVSAGLADDTANVVRDVTGGRCGPYGKRKKLVSVSCFKAVSLGDWLWSGSQDVMRSSRKHDRFYELRGFHV